jgi:hypothetical protein
VQRHGGRRRDHHRRGGRRVRQGHPPQALVHTHTRSVYIRS